MDCVQGRMHCGVQQLGLPSGGGEVSLGNRFAVRSDTPAHEGDQYDQAQADTGIHDSTRGE